MYKTLNKIAKTFFTDAQIYKYGFNWSPMYRCSTGKIIEVSDDLLHVKIKIQLSIRNKNYVGSIFGGSLFSSTDPIYMIQLMTILGSDYVVWDKNATIKYKRPAKETVYCDFIFTNEEIENIKKEILVNKEFNFKKTTHIINKAGIIISEIEKTMYIADKSFYKEKRKLRIAQKNPYI